MNLMAEFGKLVMVANLIAWPLAYLGMRFWLQDFAYQTSLGVGIFLLATGPAILIAHFHNWFPDPDSSINRSGRYSPV